MKHLGPGFLDFPSAEQLAIIQGATPDPLTMSTHQGVRATLLPTCYHSASTRPDTHDLSSSLPPSWQSLPQATATRLECIMKQSCLDHHRTLFSYSFNLFIQCV